MSLRSHRFVYRVPLYETDMGQAVYHGNYYHFFELGREACLRDLGFPYPRLVAAKLHLAIVEAHCRYRQSLSYNEEIEIITTIPQIKSRSLKFHQQLLKSATGQLATDLDLTMVCINSDGKPVALPIEFRTLVEAWHQQSERP
ncbi:MAG: acyl-CoA thioesterase [Deltaproteobacteria bacterium]|nr:acyl-CoA thioesterase [Deltaproteobacteria bacterium]MBW1952766.1 acyl-CoA thioesterase [Deltaproteobacteria bacterium]MBW1987085.1 acyl-CoA thioesterase [Deltaproteobacteria bacterium]MBW2135375.1 acyl-CoA thioesterase [Deltaproteobacteria bacterium]